jgi:hypothetical protein
VVSDARKVHIKLVSVKLDRTVEPELWLGEVEAPSRIRLNPSLAEAVPEILIGHYLKRMGVLIKPHRQRFCSVLIKFAPSLNLVEPQ